MTEENKKRKSKKEENKFERTIAVASIPLASVVQDGKSLKVNDQLL